MPGVSCNGGGELAGLHARIALDLPFSPTFTHHHAFSSLCTQERLLDPKQFARDQGADERTAAAVEQSGELFLFENHLCVEFCVFNMSVMTCATLTDILALLKVAPGVLEVQVETRSFRLALPAEQFHAICTDIETARIEALDRASKLKQFKSLSVSLDDGQSGAIGDGGRGQSGARQL